MSRLKADKLIHQASDSWHFMIWSTGRLRGESHLFKAPDEEKHGSDSLIYPEKKNKKQTLKRPNEDVTLSSLTADLSGEAN